MVNSLNSVFKTYAPTETGPKFNVTAAATNLNSVKRVANLAMPIIHMFKPASKIVKLTFLAYDIGNMIISGDVRKLASVTAGVSLKILFPNLFDFTMGSSAIVQNLYRFKGHIAAKDFAAAASDFLSIVQASAEIGLIVYGGPELLVLLLLTQAAKEIGQSYTEFANGNYPECSANLLYAALRIDAAKPHYQTVHRNLFGTEMSQTDLDQLFKEIVKIQQDPGAPNVVDFEKLLIKNNFKSKITELSFDNKQITNVAFKNILINESSFNNASVKSASFENTVFKNCDLNNARMIHSIFKKNHFVNCDLERAEFNWSSFKDSTFINSDLTSAVLNNAQLTNVYFAFCDLFESTFFETGVRDSAIISSNLKDCLLFDTKEKFHIFGGVAHEITRPVVGLLYDFEEPKIFARKIDESLKDNQAIVFKYHYLPDSVDTNALDLEVKAKLGGYKLSPKQSIPQFIIANPVENSEIAKIKEYAAKISPHIDCLAIPGGMDIQPELYGKFKEVGTFTDPNYLRSIFEFAMIEQADKKDIPTLGVCRGSQIVNVYYGGTLNQNVGDHYRVFHTLRISEKSLRTKTGNAAFNILKNKKIVGLSMHHQASDKVAKNLDVVIEHEGSPELLISKFKRYLNYPVFVLTQFHPEMISFDSYKGGDNFFNNNNFFRDLIKRGDIYMKSKKEKAPFV